MKDVVDRYKISEIFYSIQGEGALAGTPAIFVRFYGCNLNCKFCDEPLHKEVYREMDKESILDMLEDFPSKFVVITGGEPSLQDLNDLIRFLQSKGYFVAVETNGYDFGNIASADWITYSPKTVNIVTHPLVKEYKFVVKRGQPIVHILELTEDTELMQRSYVFVQPEADKDKLNKENIEFCIELVKVFPFLSLSMQLHKLLEIS